MEQIPNPRAESEADWLLRELWRTRQTPTPDQTALIRAHLSNAAFGTDSQSAKAHLAKRIDEDGEWAASTTEAEYLADLQSVFARSDVGLYLFERRGGLMLLGIAPTGAIVPQQRRGLRLKNLVAVFYSVDRGKMISGYQIQSVVKRGIPEDGLWLRR